MSTENNTIEIPAEVAGPLSPEQLKEAAQGETPQPEAATPAEGAPPKNPADLVPDQQTLEEQRVEVAKVLEAEGVKLESLEDEYLEQGGLTDASYAALEKIGFSRKVVDTYIAGVEAGNAKAAILQEQEVQSIQGMVGGAEAYAALTAWARDNLSPEEIAGFNAITATNDAQAIRMAVKGLSAQYHAQAGKDPKYLSGAAPGHIPQDVYRSWVEVTKDMGDARYKTDPAFVAQVQNKLSRSSL